HCEYKRNQDGSSFQISFNQVSHGLAVFDVRSIFANVHRHTQLPLRSAHLSCSPKDSTMKPH
ncbi:MAG: hypothetical protein JW866_09795, partial [Ignavibacteriales bacterium]|nr:hypothetical protein [Ignavibacteriales bacterium]